MTNKKLQTAAFLVGLLLFSRWSYGGSLLDYIRDYDLNDFALGVAFTTAQSPYVGEKNSRTVYPYLTSFSHYTLDDDWFVIRGSELGARWVSGNGWEFGALGRIKTVNFGSGDDLRGIADREWALELGPMIGWRGWPVQINWTGYVEVTDRHGGSANRLTFFAPISFPRGYFVPSVEIEYLDSDYTNYYYSVAPSEANPSRPAYQPGAAVNSAIRLEWGYELTDKWLLSGKLAVDYLSSEISSSPIVDRDKVWSANIGLAYNADIFQPRDYDESAPSNRQFDLRVSAFQDRIDTKIVRDTVDGVPGFEVDIEDLLGASNSETVLQVDATMRIGNYHRLEFGFFELQRASSTILATDITIGDELYPAGSELETRSNVRMVRAGYAYSLMRDAQKELGVMAGIHVATIDTHVASSANGQSTTSRASTPLPVIGVHGSVNLGEKTVLGAKLQIFRTDFDRYEGSLNYATLDIQYQLGETFSIGGGYNYYRMKLTSKGGDLNGSLLMQHHGPVLFLSAGF